jgi:hypothetical protein
MMGHDGDTRTKVKNRSAERPKKDNTIGPAECNSNLKKFQNDFIGTGGLFSGK